LLELRQNKKKLEKLRLAIQDASTKPEEEESTEGKMDKYAKYRANEKEETPDFDWEKHTDKTDK